MEKHNRVNEEVLVSEIASPFSTKLAQFLSYMPNPDEILQEKGETLTVYKRMLLDPRIFSILELRKAKALSRYYYLESEDKKVEELVYSLIDPHLYKLSRALLSCLEFGFAVVEVIWKIEDGLYKPDRFILRDPERFYFDYQGNLYLIQDGERKLLDMPYKFIVHRKGSFGENPYGSSVLKQCYWPWVFKQAGWRFWMVTAEKFGVPTVLALFETDDEVRAQERAMYLAQALANIQSDAALALGNVKDVKVVEAKGALSEFEVLIKECDNQISYAITGQSLATAEARYGTRAQAEVHEEIFEEFVNNDLIELESTLNETIIKWLVELNYGKNAPPCYLYFDINTYADLETIKIALEHGIPLSRKVLYREYNLPEPENPEDAFVSSKVASKGAGLVGLSDMMTVELADEDKKKLKKPTRKFLRILFKNS
ncbi:MAG: DUF935 family protein [Candidatus Aenigmatarchaeota archaeon]